MFALFNRRKKNHRSTRSVPAGMRVYAIGDIHGCLAEMEALLALICADCEGFQGRLGLVLLGDLVDRGPDSAGCVSRAMQLSNGDSDCHVIMGNHEEAMLSALDGTADPRGWLNYGGMQTLESYGIGRAEHFAPGFDLAKRMGEAIPPDQVAFLRGLPNHLIIGDYLFVHAGIRPGIPLEQQDETDLRWIRGGFLDSDVDHPFLVVHGHTISAEPETRANRIGIDTGCYAGGPLTALVLEGTDQRFLQTTPA